MKKLLFVIDSLNIGGAEKSLVSLLNMIDPSKYEIDLLLFKRGGDLEKHVPEYVNILSPPEYFLFLDGTRFPIGKKLKYYNFRIKTSLFIRLNNFKRKSHHSEQVVYRSIKSILKPIITHYDAAIAYSQGMPTYYVAHKVNALKKLAWINTDYVNTQYDKNVDYDSYKHMDKIITVSYHTKQSISKIRDEYKKKIDLIFDIINPEFISKLADEQNIVEFEDSFVNILTVGRLVSAKSYDKAVEVARLLKSAGYKFKWFVIGEGSEKDAIQRMIDDYNLNAHFVLLGKKINPYVYMKNCDIYVQTSSKEGFGLTVCEAKILKRPIVCTNFDTAKEIIEHNKTGLIVEHNIESIYEGVKRFLEDHSFKRDIMKELDSIQPYNSLNQLQRFYNILEKA
ncbi:glycosyltransferase [Metabacillus sp. 84]|uniref:glycosyltransferase n=1 Tax=unclassified Metabacillus TaxID=2675274 RepID=UPI003CF68752